MSIQQQPNLLIFRIGSIGDTVVSLPCFHAIARAYPRHRRILLTNSISHAKASSVEDLLRGTGLIDATVYFPAGAGGGRRSYSLAMFRSLRALKAETLIYLTPRLKGWSAWRDLLFFRLAGLKTIIGAPLTDEIRHCRIDPVSGELEHEAERLARALAPHLPVDLSAESWDLRLSLAERAVAARHLAAISKRRDLVALAPGARVSSKDWGEENWSRLIPHLQLRASRPITLVFVGAAEERELTARLARSWSGPFVNLCGELTPRESAAVLARCAVLVCHDSGPMHLAASQGTACVALFGNFNRPRQWFPFGNQHHVIYEPRGVHCIRVEQVAAGLESVLEAHEQMHASHLENVIRLSEASHVPQRPGVLGG
ncbi:MAG TPA: glycosyltransferase family 9 protein [Steroidobacteraceae bacterium]|nr:glycosyltransferase family 9 protein [Steroidobacteraceae bacterium]